MKLKLFQREDIARSALHSGVILGLEQGLGKTILAYVYSLLKVGLLHRNGVPARPVCPAEPVLFVAQGDLHGQIIKEGITHFKTKPTVIDCQATFLRLSTLAPNGRRTLPPGFYLTTYTALSRNGVKPFPELDKADPERMMRVLHLPQHELEEFFANRAELCKQQYAWLGVTPQATASQIRAAWFKMRKRTQDALLKELDEAYYLIAAYAPEHPPRGRDVSIADLSGAQRKSLTSHFVSLAHTRLSAGLGVTKYHEDTGTTVRCVYSPTLAELCQSTFAVVVCDEGTKIKGDETLIGTGTRWLNPRYRLPMTGTPIKNRLPDIFWLAHWATGGHHDAHPRMPYAADDREEFTRQFSVSERNLTREQMENRRFVKLTPQVCNIHHLWKWIAPILIRRRKEDCGEEIVKMNRHVIRVPLGSLQASVYKYYLEATYRDAKGLPAIGAKLQDLRIASANPASALLDRPESDKGKTVWRPPFGRAGGPPRGMSYTPKLACALNLIHDILQRREQFIAFSAFQDSLDTLASRLKEAGVRHMVLDGRVSQSKRGVAAGKFKRGPAGGEPGMLAGIEAMSEGHSFSLCRNVILMCYSWALDKMLQAIARIYRLDSPEDVNVYAIICDGTVERKMEANIHEKRDAAELVLDGHLLGEDPSEMSPYELLQLAHTEFAGADKTIDERELEKEWPALRAKLADAHRNWQRRPSGIVTPPTNIIPLPVTAPSTRPISESAFKDLPLWRQAFSSRR